jgi:hypothetical protein
MEVAASIQFDKKNVFIQPLVAALRCSIPPNTVRRHIAIATAPLVVCVTHLVNLIYILLLDSNRMVQLLLQLVNLGMRH